jgi:hypothetical protein
LIKKKDIEITDDMTYWEYLDLQYGYKMDDNEYKEILDNVREFFRTLAEIEIANGGQVKGEKMKIAYLNKNGMEEFLLCRELNIQKSW